MKTSKFIIAFVVAIAMVFSLTPVVFATNTNTLTSDTTVTLIDHSVLSIPQSAIKPVFGGGIGSSTYIIYRVQEGFSYYFMIDTFDRSAGVVEFGTLTWRRFVSETCSSLDDALLAPNWTYTDYTDAYYDPSIVLTIGRGSVKPVYSTFDYCDSSGGIIISDCSDDQLMDLTLNDGIVIQIPQFLANNQFVVVRSSVNSGEYKIWDFGTPDSTDGIYEDAKDVEHFTSVGFSSNSLVYCNGHTIPLSGTGFDFEQFPYIFLFDSTAKECVEIVASSVPGTFSSDCKSYLVTGEVMLANYSYSNDSFTHIYEESFDAISIGLGVFDLNQVSSNFTISYEDDVASPIEPSFSLSMVDFAPLPAPSWDRQAMPYYLVGYRYINDVLYGDIYLFSDISSLTFQTANYPDAGYFMVKCTSSIPISVLYASYPYLNSAWSAFSSKSVSGSGSITGYYAAIYNNFDLLDSSGNVLFADNSIPEFGWSWSDWTFSVDSLTLTSYGDIVYSTFEYVDGRPDDDTEDDGGGGGATSEEVKGFWNKLFAKLDEILTAIKKIGGSDVSISIENNTIIDDEDKEPFNPDIYKGVFKTLRNSVKLFSGFFGFIYDGVNNFIVYLTDTSSEFYGLFHLSGLG